MTRRNTVVVTWRHHALPVGCTSWRLPHKLGNRILHVPFILTQYRQQRDRLVAVYVSAAVRGRIDRFSRMVGPWSMSIRIMDDWKDDG